ncbi:MAG: hypothetical protein JSW07_00770 [bacterium]|nr:MAG: hypothetical protein JSW07_00770 [bacterium]
MLSKFDWLRRCRTGTDLLATLKYFSENPDVDPAELKQGAPFSAIGRLCHRCKVYAPVAYKRKHKRYCKFCENIVRQKEEVTLKSTRSIVLWGYVNQISRRLRESKPSEYFHGVYIHDEQRFLVMMQRQYMKHWLQELVIYSGLSLKGLLQIFPSLGEHRNLNMGDYLTWATHHEANLSMDQLRVRFFTTPNQLINPKKREQQGLLTYNISEFINMLEMVEVFRANLYPQEQKDLFELLNLDDPEEEQFYWGRFLGQLSQQAKDMLSAWKIRQWSKSQTEFFYDLIKYVVLPQSN